MKCVYEITKSRGIREDPKRITAALNLVCLNSDKTEGALCSHPLYSIEEMKGALHYFKTRIETTDAADLKKKELRPVIKFVGFKKNELSLIRKIFPGDEFVVLVAQYGPLLEDKRS